MGSDDQDGEADDVYVVPIEDSIDLHFFAPRDIPSVVEEYLLEAQKKGFREVRLVHGRGKGIQRQVVQGLLTRHPAVRAFRSDRLAATVVELVPLDVRSTEATKPLSAGTIADSLRPAREGRRQ